MFIIEYSKNINLCKLQISILETSYPISYSEEYALYKIKKIVNEEFFNIDDEGTNMNISELLEFERISKIRKFKLVLNVILYKYSNSRDLTSVRRFYGLLEHSKG